LTSVPRQLPIPTNNPGQLANTGTSNPVLPHARFELPITPKPSNMSNTPLEKAMGLEEHRAVYTMALVSDNTPI
jgi:hypothetical protein